MKISIRDFAPIKSADIELNGLTVIAGDNDTGKTTVGKLAYAFVEAVSLSRSIYGSMNAMIGENEPREPSYHYPALLYNLFGIISRTGRIRYDWAKGSQSIQLNKGVQRNRSEFNMSSSGEISGVKDHDFCFDTLFVETPLVWQLFDTFQGIASHTHQVLGSMAYAEDNYPAQSLIISTPHTYFDVYSRLNGAVKPREMKVEVADHLQTIESAIDGKIIFLNNSPAFQRGDETFPMESVATGIQSFGFMQRILELGLARPGFLLILDEPEVHLHPKWQLQYAKLLVAMVEHYGMSVLLTSHSSVFVETLDYVGKKKLGDKCKFYLSEREDADSVVMRDVSDDLEPIYEKLAHPLIQLSLFQGDA